jgi:hypothetical protein
VNSISRVGAELTAQTGPDRTAATLAWTLWPAPNLMIPASFSTMTRNGVHSPLVNCEPKGLNSGEYTGQHTSRLSPPIRDRDLFLRGCSSCFPSRKNHISTSRTEMSPDSNEVQHCCAGRARPHVSAGKLQYGKRADWGNTTRAETRQFDTESTNRIEATSSKLCSGVPNGFRRRRSSRPGPLPLYY